MAYRIYYPFDRKIQSREVLRARLPALTILSFLLFLVLVQLFWSEGAAYIRGTLERLPSGLKKGESVRNYLMVFSL